VLLAEADALVIPFGGGCPKKRGFGPYRMRPPSETSGGVNNSGNGVWLLGESAARRLLSTGLNALVKGDLTEWLFSRTATEEKGGTQTLEGSK